MDLHANVADLKSVFTQTSFDSAALSGFSTVAHKFEQAGPRNVTVLRQNVPVRRLTLNVTIPGLGPAPRVSVPPAVGRALGAIVGLAGHVDLGQLHQLGDQVPNAELVTLSQGYLAFHAALGQAGYAVRAEAAPGASAPPAFDSRQLGPSDVFGTLLLRPGTYQVANTVNGTTGTIVLPYPVPTGKPQQPPSPAAVECNASGFAPSAITLQPFQALAFHVNTPARITITLTKEDNGPRR